MRDAASCVTPSGSRRSACGRGPAALRRRHRQGRADRAEGWNCVTSANDPTAHAEVTAIRRACEALGTFSLDGCEIFASCEPCPMCLAAIYWARLDRIIFASSREDAAAIGFDDDVIYRELAKPVERRLIPTNRMSLPEADAVFAEWRENADKIPY